MMLISYAALATPGTPPITDDADKVVRLTAELETNPSGDNAIASRRWLMKWVTDTPNFRVSVCDILGPVPGTVPNSAELLGQYIFGNVSYQIRHGSGADALSKQVAGVQSLLRAYQTLLSADASARISYMDDLVAEEKAGKLRRRLAPLVAKNCR